MLSFSVTGEVFKRSLLYILFAVRITWATPQLVSHVRQIITFSSTPSFANRGALQDLFDISATLSNRAVQIWLVSFAIISKEPLLQYGHIHLLSLGSQSKKTVRPRADGKATV